MAKQAKNMVKYIINRILILIPLLIVIIFITFVLSRSMQVNPVLNKLGMQMDSSVYELEMERMGFNKPWYIQFWDYFLNFATGNWGESYLVYQNIPVTEIIRILFPKTIELMIIPMIFVPIIAVKLGVTSAQHRNKPKDILIRLTAFVGAGFPSFWIAGLFRYIFGVAIKDMTFDEFDIEIERSNSILTVNPAPDARPTQLELALVFGFFLVLIIGVILIFHGIKIKKEKELEFSENSGKKKFGIMFIISGIVITVIGVIPISFYVNNYGTRFRTIDSIIFNKPFFLYDTIIHFLLPAISMTFIGLSGITRQTRSSMLDVLNQDYIRTARAKGVAEKDVINKHALRNALIPISSIIIAGTAGSLLGSLFVETIFQYKGFGWTIVNAIFQGDFILINGCVIFASIIIITGNLVADVAYTIIDPRIIYT